MYNGKQDILMEFNCWYLDTCAFCTGIFMNLLLGSKPIYVRIKRKAASPWIEKKYTWILSYCVKLWQIIGDILWLYGSDVTVT